MKLIRTVLFVCVVSQTVAYAQDDARAAWQVTRLDITVTSPGADRTLRGRAIVSVRNVGRALGSTLTLRINSKAEIKAVNVGSAATAYRVMPEPRGNAQRITVTLPNPVAANEIVAATVEYSLPVAENSGLASLSPIGSQFIPLSLWCPEPNTPFSGRGADTAPFRLTVTGVTAISSGNEKSTGGNSNFDQPLNALPFFVSGNWDRVDGSGNTTSITAFLAKGATADERKQAERLIALAANARSFYTGLFGPAPDIPGRLVEVTRGGGFDDGGTILLGTGS